MFLKNEAARLITINYKVDGKLTAYKILPGENPAVEVPDAVAKLDFVKAALKNGSLRRVGADELDDAENESDGLDDLRAEAAELGVKVAKSWKEDRLREEIAKAKQD